MFARPWKEWKAHPSVPFRSSFRIRGGWTERRSSNSVRLPMSMLLVARRFHRTFDDEMTVAPMDHSPKRKWWRHRVAVLKRRTGSVRVVERLLSVFVGGSVMLGMISAGAIFGSGRVTTGHASAR